MSRLADPPPAPTQTAAPASISPAQASEARNFVVLAVHSVLLRVGWIFKTESIVMPVFLSYIGATPFMLGLLPVLNRIGLSVPPLLYAARLKTTPKKKWSVIASTGAMAAPFALLSLVWATGLWRGEGGAAAGWMPWFFLAVYGVFFGLTGVNQLGCHALHGKLIRADLRGRLFMASVLVGAPLAILAAWWLLPAWLAMDDGGFGWVFAATAVAFVAAALSLTAAAETPDNFTEQSTNPWQKFHDAWTVVRTHPDARAVGILAALASVNLMLFPHYQTVGKQLFGLDLSAMTLWICVQNAATAAISLVAGPMADRYGNRKALHFCVYGLCLGPASVLALMAVPPEVGRAWFWLVFAPLGYMPVTIRILINYTLEISSEADHPRFVSAFGMCLALPVIVGSPVVGWLFGAVGAAAVFGGGLLLLLVAGAQTHRLREPRHSL
ncbi:MAG: MFS transporter [Planctomycetota bacterium]